MRDDLWSFKVMGHNKSELEKGTFKELVVNNSTVHQHLLKDEDDK